MLGVCIKYFHENYGGMLQAFSTVSMLERRGIDYELVRYEKDKGLGFAVRSAPRLLNGVLLNDKKEALVRKIGYKKHPDIASHDALRMAMFASFRDEKFRKLSPVFYGYEELCRGAERYSAVMSGSDQLWSPAGLPTNFYNLMFVPDNIRKVSYASSFGVSAIPWYQRSRTAEYLSRIEFVSMRENRGAEIVQELTGREVPVVLDPVFSFDADGWRSLLEIKKPTEKPYLLAYFLGANPESRVAVSEFAAKRGLKVVALRHMDQFVEADESFGDEAPYEVGPKEFLDYLSGASYVCTDSFHGTCFSVIFGREFSVFNRYEEGSKVSKNSRIDTLCKNLGLESRRFGGSLDDVFGTPIEFASVYSRLSALKRRSDAYLNEALEGIA